MQTKLQDIPAKDCGKYIQALRLLHLIEGVNTSIENRRKVESKVMIKQYEHLKSQYTKEFLDLMEDYKMPISMAKAALGGGE